MGLTTYLFEVCAGIYMRKCLEKWVGPFPFVVRGLGYQPSNKKKNWAKEHLCSSVLKGKGRPDRVTYDLAHGQLLYVFIQS